ncbi:2Fe-2S iron-sulfur cluster-binding protein [Breoghania sp.]|uniref:(2Fe-2S)-binding protein n=1 Tax=Breoghania sp. TaxID=2065378 RepID=UPI002607A80A|nr:2Fe-2S iron-sulfur cluster-binding protein [Breoghania sp.]MDJ0931513.1 (2Fe-2S)-binding protein [Breoghania sp.]
MTRLLVNGTSYNVADPWADESLLVVLREHLGLVGVKCGCGEGSCGACTILIDGEATRSYRLKPNDVADLSLTTIEGLSQSGAPLHPLQQAWIDEAVAQCGFCHPGQIMQALALLKHNPAPSTDEIADWMAGNLCRCGSQVRAIRAIHRAAEAMRDEGAVR